MAPRMRLDELRSRWRRASRDEPWSWDDEARNIFDCEDVADLVASIATDGMRDPVLLGDDGRVSDGDHRNCIACRVGFETVPFDGDVVRNVVVFGQHVDVWVRPVDREMRRRAVGGVEPIVDEDAIRVLYRLPDGVGVPAEAVHGWGQ